MALTKVAGDILDPGVVVAGIVTATGFSGPFSNGTTGTFSGDVTVGGNLTVNGDYTTLNTTLREVEILRVDTNSSTTAGIITQTGSGDILNLFDGTTEVFKVADGGQTTIATTGYPQLILKDSDSNSPSDTNGISLRSANNTEYGFIGQTESGGHSLFIKTVATTNPIRLQVNSTTRFEVGDSGCYVTGVLDVASGGTSSLRGDVYIPDKLRHIGDDDTSIRFPANDIVSVETGGSEKFRVNSDGTITQGTIQVDGAEGGSAQIRMRADEGDDNNDTFRFLVEDGGNGLKIQGYDGSFQTRLTVDTDGGIGIGTADPQSRKLHVLGTTRPVEIGSTNATNIVKLYNSGTGRATYNGVDIMASSTDGAKINAYGGSIMFGTSASNGSDATERLRIDSTGRTLIGHTSSLSEGCLLQVARANDNTVELFGYSANANGARVNFTKSRNGTIGTNTIVQDDDTIGEIHFRAANGNSQYFRVAAIEAEMDGTPSASSLPGRLIFSTTASGATTQTERLRITSAGDIKIPDDGKLRLGAANDLDIYHTTSGTSWIRHGNTAEYLVIEGDQMDFRSYTNSKYRVRMGTAVELRHNNEERLKTSSTGVTVTGEVAASQDYPNYRPILDFNFAAEKKLDSRFTYQRTGPASFIDELGKVVLVGANTPRFDHDPTTRESKGLLVEETRTNLIPWSFDGGNWSIGSGGNTVTRNAGTAPDGTETATKILSANNDIDVNTQLGNAAPGATGQISISGGTTYTLSLWAKASTTAQVGNDFKIRWKRVQGDNVFTATTFALTADWTRYSTTATTAANNTTIACYVGGVSGSEALVWGAQLEAGAFATSLISTNGSSATRGTENIFLDGQDFTDAYNVSEGTFILKQSVDDTSTSNQWGWGVESSTNRSGFLKGLGFRVGGGGAGHVGAWYVDNGSQQAFFNMDAGATVNIPFVSALAYKVNDMAATTSGMTVATDTSASIADAGEFDRFTLGSYHYDTMSTGHIQRVMYYTKRLPNSQLLTLTS